MTIATCNSNPINNRLNNRLKRLPGQAAEMRASRPLSRAVRRRRAAADVQIDRDDLRHAADDRVAAGENAAVGGAIADRHHPFRVRRRGVGALQRLAHVLGDRAGHQQHVGMARRGDEAQAEALEDRRRRCSARGSRARSHCRSRHRPRGWRGCGRACRRAARSRLAGKLGQSAASSGSGAGSVDRAPHHDS